MERGLLLGCIWNYSIVHTSGSKIFYANGAARILIFPCGALELETKIYDKVTHIF
jgi:hypothetical protein